MRLAILVFILAFFGKAAYSQGIIDKFRSNTVCLGRVEIFLDSSHQVHKVFWPVGTGVISYVKTKNVQVPCIITAKHVVYNSKNNWFPNVLYLRLSEDDTLDFDNYTGIPISLKEDNSISWIPHPNGSVDLVCIPLINNILGTPLHDHFKALLYSDIADSVYEGESILVLGYPGFATSKVLVKSILRQGIVSWTNPKNPQVNTFLIDCNIFPGNSGGPVFTLPYGLGPYNPRSGMNGILSGGELKFAGIVTEVYVENQNATDSILNNLTNFSGKQIFVQQKTALAVVEPAPRIRELLDFVNLIFKNRVIIVDPKKAKISKNKFY